MKIKLLHLQIMGSTGTFMTTFSYCILIGYLKMYIYMYIYTKFHVQLILRKFTTYYYIYNIFLYRSRHFYDTICITNIIDIINKF